MIYVYVIKKNPGTPRISPVLRVLREFYILYGDHFFVSLPGFFGKDEITIKAFIDEFPYNLSTVNIEKKGYFFHGMNGREMLFLIPSSKTKQDYSNSFYGNYTRTLPSINPYRKDHSKGVILYEYVKIKDFIRGKNIDQLLKGGCDFVKAILIGSSNQSRTTYVDAGTKGEADVFLIDSSVFRKISGDKEELEAQKFYNILLESLNNFEYIYIDNKNKDKKLKNYDTKYDIILSKTLKTTNSLEAIAKKMLDFYIV